MMHAQSPTRTTGFTLLEMLITLSILGILASLAVPSLMDTFNRMAVASAGRSINTALGLARSEAVKRGRNVSICPSSSGTDCAAGSWAAGWIVFVDANGDANGAAGSVDNGDEVIRVFAALADIAVTISPSTNLLSYSNKGYGTLTAVTTFKLCPVDGDSDNARQVEISVSGRARTITSGVTCS
jgi:type IV fimbrial biogenesis protein FimT